MNRHVPALDHRHLKEALAYHRAISPAIVDASDQPIYHLCGREKEFIYSIREFCSRRVHWRPRTASLGDFPDTGVVGEQSYPGAASREVIATARASRARAQKRGRQSSCTTKSCPFPRRRFIVDTIRGAHHNEPPSERELLYSFWLARATNHLAARRQVKWGRAPNQETQPAEGSRRFITSSITLRCSSERRTSTDDDKRLLPCVLCLARLEPSRPVPSGFDSGIDDESKKAREEGIRTSRPIDRPTGC